VGVYCRGMRDALTPDVRHGHQLYDSTVDNPNHPSIYVTYHDAQACARRPFPPPAPRPPSRHTLGGRRRGRERLTDGPTCTFCRADLTSLAASRAIDVSIDPALSPCLPPLPLADPEYLIRFIQ